MENLNITQIFIPMGNSNRPARKNPMLFVTIHETGNTRIGANACAHANFLNNPTTRVSYHYSVDDKETIQHLPENEDAFHAGDGAGAGNRQSIGIEMCVNADGDFTRTIERTAALTADICYRRNISIHYIRRHFDWSRKNCPENIRAGRPITWEAFLNMVQANISSIIQKKSEELNMIFRTVQEMPDWAQGGIQQLIDLGVLKVAPPTT